MLLSQYQRGVLRAMGLDDEAMRIIENPSGELSVSADVFMSYVRAAYRAGATRPLDPYCWYDPAELIASARALERLQ